MIFFPISCLISSSFLFVGVPVPIEYRHAVLNGVNGVADDGEDDKEDDDYYCDDEVAFDHFGGVVGWVCMVLWEE